MEAFCRRHHPFKTSCFLERSMTYPVRLLKTYWLPFVRTNITLWPGFIPYMLVVGDKEATQGAVSVRLRSNENLGVMPLANFVERVQGIIKAKSGEL